MAKKKYLQPSLLVVPVDAVDILVGSATEATGEDAYWKVRGTSDLDLFSNDEDNNIYW